MDRSPYFPQGISSSVSPAASIADTSAMGKPVALDASAEEREVRGFISMSTLVPPMTPTDSTIRMACS